MARSNPAPATAGDQAQFWLYQGGVPRTYTHVPVTVEHGDVIAHDGVPAADGHWEPHPGPATRHPDNAPPVDSPAEQAPTSAGEE